MESPSPIFLQGCGQLQAHGFSHSMDFLRVHLIALLGDVTFAGQGQHQFFEGCIQLGVAQNVAQTFDQIQGQGLVVQGGAVHSRHGGFQA